MEKEVVYLIRCGNMYLSRVDVDSLSPENEFINHLEFTYNGFDRYEAFKKEEARAMVNKIYVVLGVECQIEEE